MKKRLKILGICALLVAALMAAGCSKQQNTEENRMLTASVAASLTDCMEEIQEAFNSQHPEIGLQFNFGSSGALQQQIEQGAPVDVFFSAGMKQMNALKEKGLLIDGSIEEVLKNRLALIVPIDSSSQADFDSLADSHFQRIAVGEIGSVPVGQYTMEVFENLGIEKVLEPKLIYAKDVREVLSWVETGNVDAGVVYETDAKISDKVKISDLADDSLHAPIIYPAGIVKNTKQLEDAQLFMTFLKTQAARKIFEDYGFTPIF